MTYFNTTNSTAPILTEYVRINEGQDAIVLRCFEKYRHRKMTPYQVLRLSDLKSGVPLTSVRRSISNLTKSGKLVKLDEMRDGEFGRKNYVWTLKDETV